MRRNRGRTRSPHPKSFADRIECARVCTKRNETLRAWRLNLKKKMYFISTGSATLKSVIECTSGAVVISRKMLVFAVLRKSVVYEAKPFVGRRHVSRSVLQLTVNEKTGNASLFCSGLTRFRLGTRIVRTRWNRSPFFGEISTEA